MTSAPSRLRFFLGGQDLEMLTIRQLLEQVAPEQFEDDGLAWGAKASAYRERIERTLAAGGTVVLVELLDDLGLLTRKEGTTFHEQGTASEPTQAGDPNVINVDHHGDLAGHDRPTALEQVFQLLRLPSSAWTRWHTLVAANDRGHVQGMLQCDATPQELDAIRAADRSAQGITAQQEHAGRLAAEHAEPWYDGKLTVVRLPHSRTAAVTDVLDKELGGPGFDNLLVLCPDSVMFYGNGRVIDALKTAYPTGYYGGDLPQRGFWGQSSRMELDELLAKIRPVLIDNTTTR